MVPCPRAGGSGGSLARGRRVGPCAGRARPHFVRRRQQGRQRQHHRSGPGQHPAARRLHAEQARRPGGCAAVERGGCGRAGRHASRRVRVGRGVGSRDDGSTERHDPARAARSRHQVLHGVRHVPVVPEEPGPDVPRRARSEQARLAHQRPHVREGTPDLRRAEQHRAGAAGDADRAEQPDARPDRGAEQAVPRMARLHDRPRLEDPRAEARLEGTPPVVRS